MPVQVVAGHSHIRGWRRLDGFASAHEAGCKLDTVGLASFDLPAPGRASVDFAHADVDGNTARLAEAAGMDEAGLLEPAGSAVNAALSSVRREMRLDAAVGCSDRRYRTWAPLGDEDSLWGFYAHKVLPRALLEPRDGRPRWAVVKTSALSYDIYEGPFTIDDAYTTSPFGNFWFSLEDLPGETLQALYDYLLTGPGPGQASVPQDRLPEYVATGPLQAFAAYDLVYCDFDAPLVEGFLRNATGLDLRPALFRPGSNTSSVLVDWFRQRPCPDRDLHI